MGTDIYCVVERVDYEHMRWRFVEELELGRNRDLFNILALANTEKKFKPIAPSRGLPADCDRDACDEYGQGRVEDLGWGESWVDLGELRAFDWSTPILQEGCIPLRAIDIDRHAQDLGYLSQHTYEQWRKEPRQPPTHYSGGIGPSHLYDLRAEHRAKQEQDHVDAERLIANPQERPPPQRALPWSRGEVTHVTAWALVSWHVPAREACAQFCAWIDRQTDGDRDLRLLFAFG